MSVTLIDEGIEDVHVPLPSKATPNTPPEESCFHPYGEMCVTCGGWVCTCYCYGTMIASLILTGPICFAIGPDPCVFCYLLNSI